MTPADAVVRYAARFHRAVGTSHHVASPLGAWVLLALIAPASSGRHREVLADALGCDVASADAFARALLGCAHPAVALAAAAWRIDGLPQLDELFDALHGVAEVGPMPTQAGADAWAADRTLGLIDRFPLDLHRALVALASAIATRITWRSAFEPFEASRLSLLPAPGFDAVRWLLHDGQDGAIVSTGVGLVGVHRKWSRERDLVVVSVIADPSVPAAEVLDVAHALAASDGPARRVPLAELPLGAGHSWTLRERVSTGAGARPEQTSSVLPAWSASSSFPLLDDASLGFRAAAGVVTALVPGPVDAKQVAVARYSRTGFEAAAVTAMAARMSASFGETVVREARLEFTHPYAVVARAHGGGPWDGLPVFSAWVATADESDSWDI